MTQICFLNTNKNTSSIRPVRLIIVAACCLTILLGEGCNRQPPRAPVSNVTDGVLIPSGTFIMGSDKTDSSGKKEEYGMVDPLYLNEHPAHQVYLPAYYIDKFEVTNGQYKRFVYAARYQEPFEWSQNGYNLHMQRLKLTDLETLRWITTEYFKLDLDTKKMNKEEILKAMSNDFKSKDSLPVTGISWYDANAYCLWSGKHLPSEAEWEKAARGENGLEFPWGNKWDISKTNVGDNTEWEGGIAPVGSYPQNKSPYGVYDLSGNVWEWVNDWYKPYPGSSYHSKYFGETHRVIRGGGGGIGHYSLSYFFRSAMRSYAKPNTKDSDVGFRCAWDAANTSPTSPQLNRGLER